MAKNKSSVVKYAWIVARFCVGCDGEVSKHAMEYEGCCPHCGKLPFLDGSVVETYRRVYRNVEMADGETYVEYMGEQEAGG